MHNFSCKNFIFLLNSGRNKAYLKLNAISLNSKNVKIKDLETHVKFDIKFNAWIKNKLEVAEEEAAGGWSTWVMGIKEDT